MIKVKQVMLYDVLGVSKERADQLNENLHGLVFYTSMDLPEVIDEIRKEVKNIDEAILVGFLLKHYSALFEQYLNKQGIQQY